MKENKEKTKDRYGIDKFSPKQIATIMDFINNYVIKYYLGEINEEPNPHHIQGLLYKKNKRYNSVKFELAMNLMESEGYVRCITYENDENAVKSLSHTEKGLDFFFKGGFKKDIVKKRREKWLIITGQISIILAGLYYLIELLNKFLGCE